MDESPYFFSSLRRLVMAGLFVSLAVLRPGPQQICLGADDFAANASAGTASPGLVNPGEMPVALAANEAFERTELWEGPKYHECCPTVPACNLCPCRYGYVEGLILDRNNRAASRPLVLDLNTNDVLLSTDDLNFDVGGGLRAVVGHRIVDRWAVELGYLGVFDQSTDALVRRDDSLRLPGTLGLAVNNFFAADQVDVRYQSHLHSAEVNLVHCCAVVDDCSPVQRSREWLFGFRYLRLGEQLDITSFDSAEGTSVYSATTENNLFGAQLGARWRWCRNRWSWESSCKAGLYANDVRQSQAPIIDFPGVVFRTGRSASDTDFAFVGDINLSGIYQLNDCWGVRAGYNLLWVEGVALAPDQLDFTNAPASGSTLVDGSGVFYHGVNIGLEGRW